MGSLLTYIGLILISSILGLVAFYILLSLIPFLERKENLSQKKELLNEAQKQRKVLLKKYEERAEETIKLLEEELEEETPDFPNFLSPTKREALNIANDLIRVSKIKTADSGS